MSCIISQSDYTPNIEKMIKRGMNQAAQEASGIDGWYGETICLTAQAGDTFLGAAVVELIYGQMRIDYLFVEKQHRHKSIGSQLLTRALEIGIDRGCTFAFLETLNFQAPEFYEKHGFEHEFSRPGYKNGIVFNYYKKALV